MTLRELLLVALERPAAGFGGFEAFDGFEGGQSAGSNALQNSWLGHVWACGCESCCQLPWKVLREGLKGLKGLNGLRAGKQQARP